MVRFEELPPKVRERLAPQLKAKGTIREEKMNGEESEYARYLAGLLAGGQILWWKHHCLGLRMADRTHYYPDFLVMAQDGSLEIHEYKGFMRDDAAVKLKTCAAIYPFKFKLVRRVRGGHFQIEDV